MISTIFGKTKPVNFIILLTFLFGFYWLVNYYFFAQDFSTEKVVNQCIALVLLMLSIFVVNFVIKKNKLTEANSFAILFYVILTSVFPETLTDNKAIFCSFFLLLATIRIISLRTLNEIKPKVFDATIWVLVASFFYDWALLYLILILAAIYTYEPKNIRNWLVPIAAFFAVGIIVFCVLALTNNLIFLENHFQFQFNFEKEHFFNLTQSSKVVIYILLVLVLGIFAFLRLGKRGVGKIVSMRLIALSFVIGLAVNVVITSSDNYPILITFFPAVVFMTNYIEAIKKPNLKEFILVGMIVIPLSLVFISHSIS